MLGRKFYFEKNQNKKKQHYVVCAVQWPARRSKRPNSTNPEMMQKTKKHTTHIKQMQQQNAATEKWCRSKNRQTQETNVKVKCWKYGKHKLPKTTAREKNCKLTKQNESVPGHSAHCEFALVGHRSVVIVLLFFKDIVMNAGEVSGAVSWVSKA